MIITVIGTVATNNLAIGVILGVLTAMVMFVPTSLTLHEVHLQDHRRRRRRCGPLHGRRRAVLGLVQ